MYNLWNLLLEAGSPWMPFMEADKGGSSGAAGDPDDADDNEGDDDDSKDEDKDKDKNKDKDKDKDKPKKTFSQEDVDAIIKKEKAAWKRKADQASKLAGLSEEDRKKEEERIKQEELADKERELNLREQILTAKDIMAEKGLPINSEFVALLVDEDAEKTNENIKKFEASWKKALATAVDERLKGKTPPGSSKDATVKEGEDFAKTRNTQKAPEVPGMWGAPKK